MGTHKARKVILYVFSEGVSIVKIKYDWDWMREYYARSQKNSRTSLKDVS